MTGKIPKEISCEIGPRGGVDGISKRLPGKKALDLVAALHGILSDRVRLQLLLALREEGSASACSRNCRHTPTPVSRTICQRSSAPAS